MTSVSIEGCGVVGVMGEYAVAVIIYTTLYEKSNTDASGNSTFNYTKNNRTSYQIVTIEKIVPNIADTDILLLIIGNPTIYISALCLSMVD